jgi:mRNA-degrading endonuclease toxin of MazEF toxin-antitoxin module
MNPRPGEVWLADLGLAAKTRPVVIVSRYDPEAPRATVRLERRLGTLPLEIMAEIKIALALALDLPPSA